MRNALPEEEKTIRESELAAAGAAVGHEAAGKVTIPIEATVDCVSSRERTTIHGELGTKVANLTKVAIANAPPPCGDESGFPEIAGLEITDELARGGMGVVYRAHDPALDREIAVKVLSDHLLNSPSAVRRFLDESRITGQLQHPSVPPVHLAGTLPDGRPFLAMKLIKGRTLEDLLAARSTPAQDRGQLVAVFERVCQAVGYAHSRRVIHRDLKPANVMVGAFGEVQVMDWGLAKSLTPIKEESQPHSLADTPATVISSLRDLGESHTEAGSLLGTPAYMPPEQDGGELEKVDCRSDVFGLGAILCVLLTGQAPYVGPTADSVRLMSIRGDIDAAVARLEECGEESELVALCKRCLERRPEDRPADAGALAQAVARFRTSAEERARRAEVERAEAEVRVGEQKKRRRVQAALGLTFTSLVVLVGAFAWWALEQRRARRAEAERTVDRTMEDAAARYGRARGADSDLALWAEARAAALQARDRAVAADASVEVRERVNSLVSDIEQIGKNRRLVAELLKVHASRGDRITYNGNMDFADDDFRYTKAFSDYGVNPFQLTPEQGAELLKMLVPEGRIELAAALDDWAYVKKLKKGLWTQTAFVPNGVSDGEWGKLLTMTKLIDPDPLRNRIRDAVMRSDAANLRTIAEEIDPALHPAQTVNLVATHCWELNGSLGTQAAARFSSQILLKAHRYHPGDFQINFNLGVYLIVAKLHSEALPYSTAAIALRPNSAIAWLYLGNVYSALKRDPDAIAAYRRLVELAPNAWPFLSEVASALERQGMTERADAEYRKAAELAVKFPAPISLSVLSAWERLALIDGVQSHARNLVTSDPTKLLPWILWGQLMTRHLQTSEFLTELEQLNSHELRYAQVLLIVAQRWYLARRFTLAVMLWSEVIKKEPNLTEARGTFHRYSAACAAALAESGNDRDEPAPDADARAKLRGLALGWLKSELKAWEKFLQLCQPGERSQVATWLQHWLKDTDLASVRDPGALAKLAQPERKEWQALWTQHEAMLHQLKQ